MGDKDQALIQLFEVFTLVRYNQGMEVELAKQEEEVPESLDDGITEDNEDKIITEISEDEVNLGEKASSS